MAASPFRHEVQRAPARSVLFNSSRGVSFGRYGLGDSQADAAPLAALFGGFDKARIWHFWLMWLFIFFVVPHVILVFDDGWDTLRGMIVGWSTRVKRSQAIANEQ